MSLISFQNVIAPFRNRVHLISILLITAVFAVLRLQGGRVSVTEERVRGPESRQVRQERARANDDIMASGFTDPDRSVQKGSLRRPSDTTVRKREDALKGIMNDSARKKNVPQGDSNSARQGGAQGESKRGLADIEESLGLR